MELKKLLFTYRETAQLLSVSPRTVTRLVEEDKLECVYVRPRDPRITSKSILDYVERIVQLNGSHRHPR